jgi:hypothetical protein
MNTLLSIAFVISQMQFPVASYNNNDKDFVQCYSAGQTIYKGFGRLEYIGKENSATYFADEAGYEVIITGECVVKRSK